MSAPIQGLCLITADFNISIRIFIESVKILEFTAIKYFQTFMIKVQKESRVALNPGLGGARDVAFVIISHKQTH